MPDLTRAQRDAVYEIDRDVTVKAGAGSGKTKVLAERFVHLVTTTESNARAEPDEVLAITFTEKAASEMRRRIARILKDQPADARIADVLRRLDTAYISTIHSFCFRALKESALDAPIDPACTVLDATVSDLRWAEIVGDLADTDADFIALVEHCKSEDAVAEPLRKALEFWRTRGMTREDIKSIEGWSFDTYKSRVKPLLEEIVEEAHGVIAELSPELEGADPGRDLTKRLAEFLNEVRGLSRKSGMLTADTYRRWEHLLGSSWKKDKVGEKAYSVYKEVKKAVGLGVFCADPDYDADAATKDLRPRFLRLARRVWDHMEKEKARRATLDFGDMETHARALFEDSTLQRFYRGKFKYILFDEFQDTSDLQWNIVDAFRPTRGVFIVGDEKQSIYRFRGANPKVFEQVHADLSAAKARDVDLSANFRSRPEILQFVGAFFEHLWSGSASPPDPRMEAKFSKYQADPKDAPPRVFVHVAGLRDPKQAGKDDETAAAALGSKPAKGAAKSGKPAPEENSANKYGERENIESGRRREAIITAQWLRRLVREEKPKVWDDAAKEWRGVTYGDVAILLRARAPFELYARVLEEHGIPSYVVSGGGFYERPEVADLVNFLKVIDNPLRDLALVALLRSPFVDLSDDTLARLAMRVRESAGDGDGARPWWTVACDLIHTGGRDLPDGERARLARFVGLVKDLRRRRDHLSLGDLLREAVDGTNLQAVALTRERGRSRHANIRKMLAFARAFDAAPPSSFSDEGASPLAEFIRRLEHLRLTDSDETEAAESTEAADTVKIMTVHRAKGLEFPVVVVGDLGRGPMNEHARITPSATFGVHVRYRDDDPKAKAEFVATVGEVAEAHFAQREDYEESIRLLYVACTRAREFLFLTGSGEKGWCEDLIDYFDIEPFTPDVKEDPFRPADWTMPRHLDAYGPMHEDLTLGAARVRFLRSVEKNAPERAAAVVVAARDGRAAHGTGTRSVSDGSGAAHGKYDNLLAPAFTDPRVMAKAENEARAVLNVAPPAPRPRRLSPSQCAAYAQCPTLYFRKFVLGEPEPDRDAAFGDDRPEAGGAGETVAPDLAAPSAGDSPAGAGDRRPPLLPATALGEAVHAALEEMDFGAADVPAHISHLAGEQASIAEKAGLSGKEIGASVNDLLTRFAKTDLFTRLRAARRVEREWAFSFFENGVLVNGAIDLLGFDPGADAPFIVDYKTNLIPRDGVGRLAAHYRPQMLIYGEALRRLPPPLGEGRLAEPPREALLAFVRTGEVAVVNLPPEATGGLIAAVIEGVTRGDFQPRADAPCDHCPFGRAELCHRDRYPRTGGPGSGAGSS
ncbi:MAG: UvrD-helicase domain-containing protein [Planctomycetes bacterium]|nr:UvrD-helicase domain-containing protein [Planctomycetota bacterium]